MWEKLKIAFVLFMAFGVPIGFTGLMTLAHFLATR